MIRPAAALGALIAILALLALNATEGFAHATPMVYEPNASSVLESEILHSGNAVNESAFSAIFCICSLVSICAP